MTNPVNVRGQRTSRGTYYGKQLLPIIRPGSTRSRSVPITTASL
jgi:hypothetical protein